MNERIVIWAAPLMLAVIILLVLLVKIIGWIKWWRSNYKDCVHMSFKQFLDIYNICPEKYTLCDTYVRRNCTTYYDEDDHTYKLERKSDPKYVGVFAQPIRTEVIGIGFNLFDALRYNYWRKKLLDNKAKTAKKKEEAAQLEKLIKLAQMDINEYYERIGNLK